MDVLRCLRRVVVLGLAVVLLVAGTPGRVANSAQPRVVAILYPETRAPYRQIFADILSGIEQGLTEVTVRTYPLPESPDVAAVRRWLAQLSPAVVITLGRIATESYAATGLKIPQVIGALNASPQTQPQVAGVSLAVDPALLFDTLQVLSPATQRIWVVFNPVHDRWLIELAQRAAAARHLTLRPLEATNLRAAVQQFLHILSTADSATDALWLVADAGVVDPEAVLPVLIEQSWHRRIALFSNSLQHAQRGVLFALYPDNIPLGRRLAELTLRILRTHDPTLDIEPLRAVKRVLNLKVAAHLELSITQGIERQFDLVLPPW